jgi:hypothetical protein
MLFSLLILLPLIGIFALLGRSCSFSPFGPTVEQSSAPSVDAGGTLRAFADRAPFPVREPVLPPDWRATSVDQRLAPGGARAVRVGWLTGSGHYLRLVQTNAEEGALVSAESLGLPTAAAPLSVAGVEWVRYTGGNGEPAWTRRADGVQWLITGSGVDAEFRALATAVAAAPPLPRVG